MKKIPLAGLAMGLLAVGMVGAANATIIQYDNESAFASQGNIIEDYGFEDFGTGFTSLSNPWTAHGVTYTTGDNLVIGIDTPYKPISNVFAYNGWSPIDADIETAPQYDMFALDLGYLGTFSTITFTIETNFNSYSFTLNSVPLASNSLDFYGFTASSGEYFTGFSLASQQGSGSAPVLDNVKLGQTAPVPEPATMLLFGTGLAGLAGLRKRNKK